MKSNLLIPNNIDEIQDISIDFSCVKDIDLKDIECISDIHRVALLNGKKLYIKNATKEVIDLLEATGLYSSFQNFKHNNPIKRQRGF